MRSFLLALVLLTLRLPGQDQEPATIRVRKESVLSKAALDNSALRLFVVDRYGNPRENEIMDYVLTAKTKGDTKSFRGHSNRLSGEMVNYLNKQKSAVKIFFTEITAKDDNGHAVKLPDLIEVWFPDCENCDNKRKRERRR